MKSFLCILPLYLVKELILDPFTSSLVGHSHLNGIVVHFDFHCLLMHTITKTNTEMLFEKWLSGGSAVFNGQRITGAP